MLLQYNHNDDDDLFILSDSSDNEEEETDIATFIEENNNANEIHNVDHWLQMVENWIKILDTENHLDNGEDVDEKPLEFELAGRAIHLADDPLAKWDLLNLFNDTLEASIYLDSLTNCN